MAKSLVFAKNKLQGCWGIEGPSKLKLVSVKKWVSVKIGNSTKIGISIGIIFLLEEKKSVSVSVCYLLHIIGIGKVTSSIIG